MASTRLSNTMGTPTLGTKFTYSAWVKRSGLGSAQTIASIWLDGSNHIVLRFDAQDNLSFYANVGGSYPLELETNAVFRDVSAFYNIVAKVDTTQGTSSNRCKLYVNGSEQTSLSTSTYPSQDATFSPNASGTTHYVGGRGDGSYWDGLITHTHFTDGYAYNADTFGETDSTSGIWKPKTSPSVTYGTNGFFLKFENSGAMGTDSSGNSNTFTVNGTLTQNVDTPSNNFSTLNPLDVSRNGSPFTKVFSNGNLTVTTTDYIAANGSLGASSGKFYWEFKLINSSASNIYAGGGVIKFDGWDGQGQGGSGANTYIYATSGQKVNNGSGSSFGATLTAGDIVGVALDLDNGFLYFSKNGTWQNSGVPTSGASGTGNAFSSLSGTFAAHLSDPNDAQDHDFSINFGQGYFGTTAVASAGTAPSEGGIFEYDCPSGYQALCTKGINSF